MKDKNEELGVRCVVPDSEELLVEVSKKILGKYCSTYFGSSTPY